MLILYMESDSRAGSIVAIMAELVCRSVERAMFGMITAFFPPMISTCASPAVILAFPTSGNTK